uniref:methanol oxidation system protein MoxJ n=1 Tax=Castellaniella defragrans TaxID=75697 RepID=UPI0033425FEE
MMTNQKNVARAAGIAGCAIVMTAMNWAVRAENTAAPLRICAAENEAPYSLKDESGFENRIANIVAKAMGRDPVFVWSSRPAIYLVQDYLDKNLCDVLMGVDQDDPRVLTTRPYYRSGYVFVSRQDRNLKIDDWNSPVLGQLSHIAVGLGSPAEAMLRATGLYENNMNYIYSLVNFKSPRNQYVRVEPSLMVSQVIQGKADLAIAFGAEVARYVRNSTIPLKMEFVPPDTVPDQNGKTIEFDYSESMAVRKGEDQLLKALNDAIEASAPQIEALLKEEGVPLRTGKS